MHAIRQPALQVNNLDVDVLASWFRFKTFATASSRSSCVTCCRRSRSAYMPAHRNPKTQQLERGANGKEGQRTGFGADTLHLGATAIIHLLRQGPEVDPARERHLRGCRVSSRPLQASRVSDALSASGCAKWRPEHLALAVGIRSFGQCVPVEGGQNRECRSGSWP